MNFEETKKHIEDNCTIIEYNNGHIKQFGRYAGIYKNPYWTVKDNDNNNIMLMYCETNTVFKLCLISYQKILDYETINDCKITWSKCKNGYIIGNNKLYIHQIITGCYGNGKGTNNISVDHIDQNPLNNSWNNLRIATREEQEQNSKGIKEGTKRERKQSAKSLPEGITQNMIKKYVVYYHEWLNKEKTRHREYFKIEKHPKLDKIWIGCKSNKVSIQEKLNQANNKVQDLDNDIYPYP
jgi:hypothetical protein